METRGVVAIRGVIFPTEHIIAECLALGGKVVQQPELNAALDKAYEAHVAMNGSDPDAIFLSKEPAIEFIPRKVRLHDGPSDLRGRPSNLIIYFAIPRIFAA